jgi:hypothetical protein
MDEHRDNPPKPDNTQKHASTGAVVATVAIIIISLAGGAFWLFNSDLGDRIDRLQAQIQKLGQAYEDVDDKNAGLNAKIDELENKLTVPEVSISSSSIKAPLGPEETQALCETAGGEWSQFPNACADSCEYNRDPEAILCAQVLIESCDCGADKCWNGQGCEFTETE